MPPVWRRAGHSFDPAGVRALPATAYADPEVFAVEERRIFNPGTAGMVYLGHERLLPERGHRRSDADERIVLTRDTDGTVRALANVCTHACRPLVNDDEPGPHAWLRCPYHDWAFRADGSLIGGRDIEFGTGPAGEAQRQRLALRSFPVLDWHGFQFGVDPSRLPELTADLARVEADFAERGIADWLDLDDWVVVTTQDDPYRGDWKMFLEVFGDCYHVPPYHPGLASFVDCASIEWTFGDNFHVQFLKLSAERGARSDTYRDWADGLDRYYALRGETTPEMAVAWTGIYPNLMYEAYNGLRVISIVVPLGHDQYVNRAHYLVPSDMEQLVPGLATTIIAAYDETVLEDRTLLETRVDGLRHAATLDLDIERYHVNLSGSALEAGVAHFHDWWAHRGIPTRAARAGGRAAARTTVAASVGAVN